MTPHLALISERMDHAHDRTIRTVNQLIAYRDLDNDVTLSKLMGMGRTKIGNYRRGETRFSAEMLAAFACVLGVPDYVLGMEPNDAMRWVLDNAPNGTGTTDEQGLERLYRYAPSPFRTGRRAA